MNIILYILIYQQSRSNIFSLREIQPFNINTKNTMTNNIYRKYNLFYQNLDVTTTQNKFKKIWKLQENKRHVVHHRRQNRDYNNFGNRTYDESEQVRLREK